MTTAAGLPVLATVGMIAEARIAQASGVVTLAGGGDPARLALMLQAALDRGAKAVISFGIAGGLVPGLRPGTTILAQSIAHGGTRFATDAGWLQRLVRRLPEAVVGDLAGVDRVVVGASAKHDLRVATGTVAVDMESHIAARLAAQYGVPFAALRVIADPAERTLPEAATVGMRSDGSMDGRAVMRALARRPGELPGLIRTAMDASAAFAALRGNRQRLGATLAFDDIVVVDAEIGHSHPAIDRDGGLFGQGGEIQVENG